MFKALVRKTRIPCVQIQAPPPMITVRAERMLKKLNYFWVGDFYGGNQNLLPDFIMRYAGCAALTACDSFIYLKLYKDKKTLCPFSDNQLKGKEYTAFFKTVKPYLRPRLTGINRLDIFISGVKQYLADKNRQ